MADFSMFTGVVGNWMRSGIFWMIATAVIFIGLSGFLWFRKRSALKYNVLEVVRFGNGKVGINSTKAGLFKDKSALFGLFDYGTTDIIKTKDGRQILDATTHDLHDIFGKKGFIVKRKEDDNKILVPISRVDIKNEHLLGEIAPADFRDASIKILQEDAKETMGMLEKYLPYITAFAVIVFFVIAMFLATQFFNRTVDKAGEILLKAGQQAENVVPSGTAP